MSKKICKIKRIEEYCKVNNLNIIEINEGKTTKDTFLILKCKICGDNFTTNFDKLKFRNKEQCNKCGQNIINDKLKLNFKIVEDRMQELGYIISSTDSDYKNYKSKIRYICSKHPELGEQCNTWNILRNNTGCKQCGRDGFLLKTRLSASEYRKRFELACSNELELCEEYVSSYKSIQIIHKPCGTKIYGRPYRILKNEIYCPICDASIYEHKVGHILNNIAKNWKPQYSFSDLKDIFPLRFDFAILNEDKVLFLIEVQGNQHYKPVQFGGISIDRAEKQYETNIYHDKMKAKYCEDNNIPLLILNFNHMDLFETHIKEFYYKYNS